MEDLELSLRDGARIHVRRLLPTDRDRIAAGVAELSEESRVQRFHAGLSRLSKSQLRYLSEVDQQHHLAWGAEDRAHPEVPGVGVVRCVELTDRVRVAEFAVTVADAYQGRGLGSLLLGVIAADAHAHGFQELLGVVQLSNAPMLGLLERLGAIREPPVGSVVEVLVSTDIAIWPDNPTVARIRQALG